MSHRPFAFPLFRKLHLQREFQKVFSAGRKVAHPLLLLYGCPNSHSWCRLGVSVSRKEGTAVERNRIKRRIREAFRLLPNQNQPGLDLVVRPDRKCLTVPFSELQIAFQKKVDELRGILNLQEGSQA